MITLDLEEFERESAAFDRAVCATPGIDHFCSSSDWILPADRALMPPRRHFFRRCDAGWVALTRYRQPAGWHNLQPLEAAWGLGCPFAGDDMRGLLREFVEACANDVPKDVLILTGIPEGSALLGALVETLADRYRLEKTMVPPTRRYRADLRGGVDGFLSRRSSGFRTALRQAERKAALAGIAFEPVSAHDEAECAALYKRVLAVEERSWKGQEGVGIAASGMEEFYRLMVPRLARRGALRARVARHRDRDVAFIFGGLISATVAGQGEPEGPCYRGLQFSFNDEYRAFSLGNLAQLSQIAALCAEGVVTYDLGSEVDYKRRWGEECMETLTLVGIPRRV